MRSRSPAPSRGLRPGRPARFSPGRPSRSNCRVAPPAGDALPKLQSLFSLRLDVPCRKNITKRAECHYIMRDSIGVIWSYEPIRKVSLIMRTSTLTCHLTGSSFRCPIFSYYMFEPCGAAMAYDLRLLLQRIDEHLTVRPRISISEMARQLKVERHTIERSVRMGSGRTFRELQAEKLLAEALRLLAADPTRSVKEVSFLLGYGAPRSFRRFIKQACGRSPKEVRFNLAQAGAAMARQSRSTINDSGFSSPARPRKPAKTVP